MLDLAKISLACLLLFCLSRGLNCVKDHVHEFRFRADPGEHPDHEPSWTERRLMGVPNEGGGQVKYQESGGHHDFQSLFRKFKNDDEIRPLLKNPEYRTMVNFWIDFLNSTDPDIVEKLLNDEQSMTMDDEIKIANSFHTKSAKVKQLSAIFESAGAKLDESDVAVIEKLNAVKDLSEFLQLGNVMIDLLRRYEQLEELEDRKPTVDIVELERSLDLDETYEESNEEEVEELQDSNVEWLKPDKELPDFKDMTDKESNVPYGDHSSSNTPKNSKIEQIDLSTVSESKIDQSSIERDENIDDFDEVIKPLPRKEESLTSQGSSRSTGSVATTILLLLLLSCLVLATFGLTLKRRVILNKLNRWRLRFTLYR